jgi:hypothetical protein
LRWKRGLSGLRVVPSRGAAEPPRSLTPFQFQCASEVAQLLRKQDLSFRREQIEGKGESYFIFSAVSRLASPLKIYVYEDEAGFFLGERWHIWETPDYETPQALMSSFLAGLQSTIEELLKESPATS